jgi:CHAD domain-containing protein
MAVRYAPYSRRHDQWRIASRRVTRPFRAGVRRIAGEQIGRALKELDNGDLDVAEKVHRVRKRCKKLRGLLHLIGPVFDNFDAENKAYRNAARLLSGVRDRRILLRTYDALTSHLEDQVDLRTFAPIRIKLCRRSWSIESADPQTEERMQAFRRNMEAGAPSGQGVEAGQGGL